jgi:hypothetical protein
MHNPHQFNSLARADMEGIKENAVSLYVKSDFGVIKKLQFIYKKNSIFFVVYGSVNLLKQQRWNI